MGEAQTTNQPNETPNDSPDEQQAQEIEALRQSMMRTWWRVCLLLWLTVGLLSLWWVRSDLQELQQYFTWTAVRFMLVYHRIAAMGLGLCFGLTLALLFSESRQILWGISETERSRLLNDLSRIHAQGPSHPQWKLIQPEKISEKV
ncbi:MAG: hypothetical protein AAFQ63_00770 [Cyanobacteria bacterium J06621_11]